MLPIEHTTTLAMCRIHSVVQDILEVVAVVCMEPNIIQHE